MATLTCDGKTFNLVMHSPPSSSHIFRSVIHDDEQSYPNNTFNYSIPEREPGESFTDYWARVRALGECSFCGESGHQAKQCPTLKTNQCVLCGFCGHTPRKCNKAARAPDGKRVGRCTFCKGDLKWGHWLVTCPARQERYGDFIFPEGTDTKRALAPLK